MSAQEENQNEEMNHFETLVRDLFYQADAEVLTQMLRSLIADNIAHGLITPSDSKDLHLLHDFIKDLEDKIHFIDIGSKIN